MKLLSVIVPCYNEEENVPYFYEELMKQEEALKKREIGLELIYVDDGSKDKTVAEVKKLHEKDERVHLVSFSRNFGKEAEKMVQSSHHLYKILMERTAYFSVLAPVFKSLCKLKVAKMAISQLKLALSPSVAIYLGQ